MAAMPGMKMAAPSTDAGPAGSRPPSTNADRVDPKSLEGGVNVDNVAVETRSRQAEAGAGLDGDGRRSLRYADLKARDPQPADGLVDRDLEFHLTGNMQRWTWGFDGKKFSQAEAIKLRLGERVRFVLINDTMMEHPIHLHGFLFSLERNRRERTRTERKNPGRHATQRSPSSETPPPGTMQ
jgi:FtsP/CotA-like multicopper oxidase with cupredoxin domain